MSAVINLPGVQVKAAEKVGVNYKIEADIVEALDKVDERLARLVEEGKVKPQVVNRTALVEAALRDFVTKMNAQLNKAEKAHRTAEPA